MGIVAASEAGIPMLLKPLLDHGFGAKGSDHAKWLVPAAVVGLALVRGAAQYASGYFLSYVTNKILLQLRLEMFHRMIHTSAGFFQRETASTVINAIVFEVNQILNVLSSVVVTLVRDSLTVVFLLGYLFILNWRLTLIVAVILPLIGWLVSKINRRLRRLNREHQALTNELSYVVEETVGGYKVVKVHNGERYEIDRFSEMSHRLRGYSMRMQVSGGLAQPLTQFLASIALAIVLTIAVVQSAQRPDDGRRFRGVRHVDAAGDFAAQASDRHQSADAARHDRGGTDLRADRRTGRARRRRPRHLSARAAKSNSATCRSPTARPTGRRSITCRSRSRRARWSRWRARRAAARPRS